MSEPTLSPIPTIGALVLSGHVLAARRGDRLLFNGLSFSVSSGQALFVSGHNGAGKTTLLRMISGLTLPAEGVVEWCGLPVREAIEERIGDLLYIGHRGGNKDELSCVENLAVNLALFGEYHDEASCLDGLRVAGLAGLADLPVRSLSQGQQRRIALARLVLSRARLWILDEPFTALDQQACAWVVKMIEQHLRSGGVVVLTSHQALSLDADVLELHMGGG